MKRYALAFTLLFILLAWAGTAFAEENVEGKAAVGNSASAFYFGMTVLAAGVGIALATIGTGLAQGNAVAKAVEGIARQPEAAGSIQTVMIIGLAFIESLTIYALLISLILLFVNPFAKYF